MKSSKKSRWILPALIVLIIGSVFGYQYWKQENLVLAETPSSGIMTRQARTGSIILAASGSVTLMPSQEQALVFTVSGTVARLNVAVGDTVKEGQVLAQLNNLEALEAEIKNAEQELLFAEQELVVFKAKAPANLANAQLRVIEAQKALADAQNSVVGEGWERCDEATKETLLIRYNRAVDQLNALGDGGGHADYYLNVLLPEKRVVDQALAAYQACAGYTEYQVASTQINLTAAQAQLQQAQEALETLSENDGLDPAGRANAENKAAAAQQALKDAQEDLDGATLTAPFDGTILSIAGKAGDTIEITSRKAAVTFITISDLAHPLLEFSIDETDMDLVAKGKPAEVTFDAFPDRTFTGSVTRVDPTITSTDGVAYVSGLIELDLTDEENIPAFPKNLSGSVQIIQASVDNALLIPREALHQQSDGSYAIYLLGEDGQPVLTLVEIGLRDAASVEIKKGLTADDIVITGGLP